MRPALPAALRRAAERRCGALAAHLRLLELRGGDRTVERGAQLLRGLKRQFERCARAGLKLRVDEVERNDVPERCMARVVVGDNCGRERKPLVAALGHAFRARDLDDGRAHVRLLFMAHGPVGKPVSTFPDTRGLLLSEMLAEESQHLAPAVHRGLGPVEWPVPVPDAVTGAVVAIKLVTLAVLLQRRLVLVHLLGA